MKSPIFRLHRPVGAAQALLVLGQIVSSGCSGGGGQPTGSQAETITVSDLATIKSKTKSQKEFVRAVHQLNLQKEGIIVRTKTAGKIGKRVPGSGR